MVKSASSILAHVCRCPILAILLNLPDIQVEGVGVLLVHFMAFHTILSHPRATVIF